MKLRSVMMLLCASALASCATLNAKPNVTANSDVPPVFEGQFACPVTDATKLPGDAQLRSWDAERVFAWGTATWNWGNGCAELLDFNRHFRDCENGDAAECTYVNQLRPRMIEEHGTDAAKAAEAQRSSS